MTDQWEREMPQKQALRNVINYHFDIAAPLLRQSKFATEPKVYEKLMAQAGHHLAIVDDCRRRLWLDEHRKR